MYERYKDVYARVCRDSEIEACGRARATVTAAHRRCVMTLPRPLAQDYLAKSMQNVLGGIQGAAQAIATAFTAVRAPEGVREIYMGAAGRAAG
jgi:hypothetical protein